MFNKFIIDFPTNLFQQLSDSKSIKFQDITNGRKGANIIDCKDNLIPLVRTTSIYNIPNQKFLPIHYDIIDNIKKSSKNNNLEFNNALIEIYNSQYQTMGYHSDQALDLNKNSHICIFSCYDNPKTKDLRKLIIKDKITKYCFDIILDHNSIVMFSTDTNSKHLHKIVLEQNTSNNLWLGITFRQSKTFISFNNELPYFSSTNKILTLATDEQKKEFYKLRSHENSNVNFEYPEINYTISNGDMMPI